MDQNTFPIYGLGVSGHRREGKKRYRIASKSQPSRSRVLLLLLVLLSLSSRRRVVVPSHSLRLGRFDFGVEYHVGVLSPDDAHLEDRLVLRVVHARQQVARLARRQFRGHVPVVLRGVLVVEHHLEEPPVPGHLVDDAREVHEQAVVVSGFQRLAQRHRQRLLVFVHFGAQLVARLVLDARQRGAVKG